MKNGDIGIASKVTENRGVSGMLHPIPPIAPEMELLLCCGGPLIQASNGDRIYHLAREGLNWELVFKLAFLHGMLPLLYWNLTQRHGQQREIPVPLPVMEVFREGYLRNVGLALRMTGDLLAILEKLQEVGVTAIPYKGPILASRLYGSLGLRRSVDLDIIVRKCDLQNARKILSDLGYAPSIMLLGPNHEFQVESRYSERFERPGSVVELHWAFTNKDVAFPLVLDDLMPRLTKYQVSGRPIRVFGPEDTLLILCVHGAKHGWARLEWICGVAELVYRGAQLQWPELISRATETRSLRRLLLGLCLAHDLFRAPLPEDIEERIRDDRQIPFLAAAVTSSLFGGDRSVEGVHTFGTLDHDLFHFRLGDRFPDSLRYLAYRLTTPSRPERWSTISVGGRSITLHSFTRPFGIVAKLVPAVWRRYGLNRVSNRGHRSDRRHGD
jgi:hypothetical protein